jgi:hypothetical protein
LNHCFVLKKLPANSRQLTFTIIYCFT